MSANGDEIKIVYDGECPFCSNYVGLVRLREHFSIELVDARAHPELAKAYAAQGYDLADGMIVESASGLYYGADAINMLSLLSMPSGLMNRLLAMVFRHAWLARALYPAMKLGRRLTLFLLGKSRQIVPEEV